MCRSSLALFAPLLASLLALSASVGAQLRTRLSIDFPFQTPSAVLAYDDARERVVMALPNGDMTEWDGSSWMIAWPTLTGQPLAAAYDPVRQRTFFLLFSPVGSRLVEYDGVSAIDRGVAPTFVSELTVDLARGRLVAMGQAASGGIEVMEWDGATWIRPQPATQPATQVLECAAYDENRNVTVAVGSLSLSTGLAHETWEWNGTAWALRLTETGPGFGRFVYDPVRRKVVTAQPGARAWDGTSWVAYTAQVPNDEGLGLATDRRHGFVWRIGDAVTGLGLWRLDASGWRGIARRMHAGRGMGQGRVAFDEARGRFVAFDLPSSRVAEWDGFHWSEASPAVSPAPRDAYSMAYDSTRAKVVLFGGLSVTTGQLFGDTWTWDGTWQLAATSGPPALPRQPMADDRSRGRLVMIAFPNNFVDRWEWDGANWRQVGAMPQIVVGSYALGYDELRQRLVFDTGLGTYEEVAGQWLQTSLASSGSQFPNLVWNAARQRLQMTTFSSTIDEYDGTAWWSIGTESGELAYDRSRNTQLSFTSTELAQWSDTPAAAFDLGHGCGKATSLLPFGQSRVGNADFHVDLRTTGGVQFAGLVLGLGTGNQQLGGGCAYYVQQELTSLVALTNDAGFLHQQLPVPAQTAFLGVAVTLQGGVLDPQSAIGVALSPGLRLVLGD